MAVPLKKVHLIDFSLSPVIVDGRNKNQKAKSKKNQTLQKHGNTANVLLLLYTSFIQRIVSNKIQHII